MRSLSETPAARAVRYDVTALSSPGLVSLILSPFARRSLIPDIVQATRHGDTTIVEVTLNEMPTELLAGCEASLRQLIDVLQVAVRRPGQAHS